MKLKNRIVVIVSALTITFALCFLFFPTKKIENSNIINIKVCSSPTCKAESMRLSISANRTIDPCMNFYEHACGNVLKLYKQYDYISQLFLLAQETNYTLQRDLNSYICSNDTIAMRTVKLFYKKCNARNSDNRRNIQNYITLLGGWPLLENQNMDKTSANPYKLYKTIIQLKAAKISMNIPFIVNYNSAANMLDIKPLQTLLYKDESIQTAFHKMSKIAHFLGGDSQSINWQINQMHTLEMKMRKHFKSHNTKGKLYTIRSLMRNFPGIDWKLLVEQVSFKDTVILHNIQQTKKISDLMLTYENTFINFLIWHAISPYRTFIEHEIKFWQLNNFKNASLDEINEQRTEQCFDMSFVTIGLNAFYVSKYVKNASKEIEKTYSAIEMVAKTFFQSIAANDQMAVKAIFHLKTLRTMMGHPELLMYENVINSFYSLITHEKRNLFEFYADIIRTDEKIKLYLYQYTDSFIVTEDDIVIAHTDAGYDPHIHRMFIPGGILHPPFYHHLRPNYLNYGGIGFLLGHEIIHAANYRNIKKEGCLIRKFSNYHLSQINKPVNGALTVPENFADYFGIRFAYEAYKVWKANQTEEEHRLQDFKNYTSEQMFWLSAAGLCCEYSNNQILKEAISSEVHSPGEARINVGFASNENFARDFNCPLGSAMNPRHKC